MARIYLRHFLFVVLQAYVNFRPFVEYDLFMFKFIFLYGSYKNSNRIYVYIYTNM